VAVVAKTEQHQLEARHAPARWYSRAKLCLISVCRVVQVRVVCRHSVNLSCGDGYVLEKARISHLVVAGFIVSRDRSFVAKPHMPARPLHLGLARGIGKPLVQATGSAAAGERDVEGSTPFAEPHDPLCRCACQLGLVP
jgi:hypothetical protein